MSLPTHNSKCSHKYLLQNAVDVLPKLDVHSRSQSLIEVARLIQERYILSRAVLILSFRMIRLDNKRMCSLPVHDPQVSKGQYNVVTTYFLTFDNINKGINTNI